MHTSFSHLSEVTYSPFSMWLCCWMEDSLGHLTVRGSSFLVILQQPYIFSCQNQPVKNHNPYMSHFQLMQAQLVPVTDFLSWNVKCRSLSSRPPASMHCWQFFIHPLALEDKGSCQGVLVCNTMIHFAKTTGSVLESKDIKTGSSKYKDSIVWKIFSVRKV